MTIIEVVLLVLGVVAALIAYQARHDHLNFKQETSKDIDALKADVAKLKAQTNVTVTTGSGGTGGMSLPPAS